jgi:integrase
MRERTDTPGVWKRGERYQVWYTCSGCKPDGSCPGHTETQPAGSLLRDAKARRAELATKKNKSVLVGRRVRVSVYAPEWLESQKWRLKPKTVQGYEWGIRAWILPNLGQRYVSEVTTDDVARLIATMKAKGLKTHTVNEVLKPLRGMFNIAVRAGLASSHPVKALTKAERPKGDQRQMRILSSEEIERLLSPVPLLKVSGQDLKSDEEISSKPPLSDDWRPLITFLLFTGLRIGEALNTRWEDIDLESGTVTVTESKTQAGTGRSVILIPALVSILRRERLRSAYSALEDYVFASKAGGILNRHYILSRVLKPALEEARIPHTTLHELRHTFASILIGQGMDVTFVADQLGHADPAITLRVYAKLFDPQARKDEAREKLQLAFGGLL